MSATVTCPSRAGVTSVPSRRSRLIRLASTALPPARLSTPPLRTAGSHQREQRPASWLELFFDLVFAGAIGQLAGALQDHPALGTLARFAMLFTPIWWLWVQFTFYADRHESDDAAHRVAFLSAMVLCVGLAASGPRALSGHTTAFAVTVMLLRGLQLLLYTWARRHLPATRVLYTRYLIFFGTAGVLWLASLAAGGAARYAFWAAALLTDAAGALEMLPPSRPVPVNPWHLADRFQLLVLIVLGESVARLISAPLPFLIRQIMTIQAITHPTDLHDSKIKMHGTRPRPIGCEPLCRCPSYLIYLARSGRGMYHTPSVAPLSRHQARVSGPHGESGIAPAAGAARLKADPWWRACSEAAASPAPAPQSRWLSSGNRYRSPQEQLKLRKRDGPMSWLDEMEAADPAYPGDVSYPAAGTRAGRGLYQLHAVLDDGHLDAGRDLIADWYARQANHVNEARPGGSGREWRPVRDPEASARGDRSPRQHPQPHEYQSPEYQAAAAASSR